MKCAVSRTATSCMYAALACCVPTQQTSQDSVHQAINKELIKARDEAGKQAHERHTRCSLLEAQLRDSQEEKAVLSEQVCAQKHIPLPMHPAKVGKVAAKAQLVCLLPCVCCSACVSTKQLTSVAVIAA